ncbi:MAG: DUF1801 domain-containing protein [Acidobacteria bacterium]|nr:DUF1801 domain-containing protein [Acidobacteriota bacterium]
MTETDTAIATYIASLPVERQDPVRKIRKAIRDNLPTGFKEVMGTSPAYVVPLERFPAGYHCTPSTPLALMSLVSQKNSITLHHFGLYMNPALLQWFTAQYAQQVGGNPDMGKGCVRFKKMEQIPYKLIGELVAKINVEKYLDSYQKALE